MFFSLVFIMFFCFVFFYVNNKHLCVHKEEVHIPLIAQQCVYMTQEQGLRVQRFHPIEIDLFSYHSVQKNLTHGLHALYYHAFTANKILCSPP